MFEASLEFIILMFWFGLEVCFAIDALLYICSMKDIPGSEESLGREAA